MDTSPLERLETWFRSMDGTLTAFSGGVDSALALYLSRRFLGEKGVGVIADSPSLKRADLEDAKAFCKRLDITLRIIETNELEKHEYASNPFNRCYYCKDTLYTRMREIVPEYPGYVLLNGTNKDDLGDYRPGLAAAKEHEARSPLMECGIGKAEVRALAKEFGLPVWNKPASPCLSSRIPYGQSVTREKLEQIEAAEIILGEYGFKEARARHYGEEALIEVRADEVERLKSLNGTLEQRIRDLGFTKVLIDEEGFVSGKLNRVLTENG